MVVFKGRKGSYTPLIFGFFLYKQHSLDPLGNQFFSLKHEGFVRLFVGSA